MKNVTTIQTEFLHKIQDRLKPGTLLATEIKTLLQISRSESYNKISGKSALTLTQIQLLSKKYRVPFEIGKPENQSEIKVSYTPFHTGNISIGNYIASLNKTMENLQKARITKLTCATDDIPFFYLFKYPELTAFKLYFWESRIPGKMNSTASGISNTFDLKKVNKKSIKAAFELNKTYCTIPTLEIWTKGNLLITIDQIKSAYESQLLKDRKLTHTICDQLLLTLDDIEQYAINSYKTTNSATFDWYECDVVGNVAYLAETPLRNISFLRFNTFNNITSEDSGICKEVEMWMQFLLNNSTGFSGHGSKQRNNYLQRVRNRIHRLKEKL